MTMNKCNQLLVIVALAILCQGLSANENDQRPANNTRMDRTQLNIGAYLLAPYARTERHVQEIADCKINFMVCVPNDKTLLDLFEKYGIGACVTGVVPGWWGGDGTTAGRMAETNPMAKYEQAAKDFVDHPAVWAIDIGDEPSALDFPYCGKVMDYVGKEFPNQFVYLVLYPNYASVSHNSAEQTVNQLGTATYAEYIAQYCEHVDSDYICFDHYMYSASIHGWFENLRIVADACLRTGRSLWIIPQVNSSQAEVWLSENRLRVQAYSSLAFGAESIIWACYTAGWFHNQVLDDKGEKTEQYDKLRKVNTELAALGTTYMKYRRVSTHFINCNNPAHFSHVSQPSVATLSTGVFTDVTTASGEAIVVGQMCSRQHDGSHALMICNVNDPEDQAPATCTITFRANGKNVSALDGNGQVAVQQQADGSYAVELKTCHGVLIIAE